MSNSEADLSFLEARALAMMRQLEDSNTQLERAQEWMFNNPPQNSIGMLDRKEDAEREATVRLISVVVGMNRVEIEKMRRWMAPK